VKLGFPPSPRLQGRTVTPTLKATDKIQYGFKRLSTANLFEPDEHPVYPSRLRGEKWVRECLKPQLAPGVPEEVAFLFETARGAMIYGLFFLPVAALATEEGFRVLEAGVRHRCQQLGLGKKKSGKANSFPDKPYLDLVNALHRAGKISDADWPTWKSMVWLRNNFSHRTSASIRARHEAIAQLAYIAELLNRLFK
jgi:hypothetical protein